MPKDSALLTASAKLDLLRLLVRLAKDCKCLTNQAYQDLESKLHEAGRMLGDWLIFLCIELNDDLTITLRRS